MFFPPPVSLHLLPIQLYVSSLSNKRNQTTITTTKQETHLKKPTKMKTKISKQKVNDKKNAQTKLNKIRSLQKYH